MKDGIPGPGSYQAKSTIEVPSSKFGTGNRDSFGVSKIKVPGPGEYAGKYENVSKSPPKYG